MRRNRIKPAINITGRNNGRPSCPERPATPLTPTLSLNNSPSPLPPFSMESLKSPPPPPSDVPRLTLVGSSSPTRRSATPNLSPQRPSPASSPVKSVYSYRPSPSPTLGGNRQLSLSPCPFNNNSNSGDSHSSALSLPSSGGIFVPPKTLGGSGSHQDVERSITPGAFSSIAKDSANSIVNNSELLRERLKKPSAALMTTKYHLLRKEFLSKAINQSPERKQLTMLHFAFWNPPKQKDRSRTRTSSVCSDKLSPKSPEEKGTLGLGTRRATVAEVSRGSPLSRRGSIASSIMSSDDEGKGEKTGDDIGPRVKVGPNGQLIIDEQSLIIETSEAQRAKTKLSEMETVSGADFVVGSSGLFRNKKSSRRGQDWTTKETVKFYRALSMCGTDFSMVTTLFPGRSRAELKAKFKREDRKNPAQISLALSCQTFDPEEGITDSEDDEEEYELDSSTSTFKPTHKKKGKKNKKPLIEIERRIQEDEDQEQRESSSMGSEESDSQDENKKSKLPLKKRSGGRPKAAWKSNEIIDDDTGKTLISKKSKRRKSSRIMETETDDEDEEWIEIPPPKPKRNRRKPSSRAKNAKNKRIDIEEMEKDAQEEEEEEEEEEGDNDNAPLLENIEMLRFDDSDPLGLNVRKTTIPMLQTTASSSTPQQEYTSSIPCQTTLRRSSRTRSKSATSPVKSLPYRVPGPGIIESPSSPSTLVDEIEIEIACQ